MGCFTFLKVLMFAFNGIIFLAGVGILGVGIWVKVDSGSILSFLGKIENAPPELGQVLNVGYLLIAIGSLLVIIGFLGCCGAIRENRCMLLLSGVETLWTLKSTVMNWSKDLHLIKFFIIVLLVFITEVAGAVVVLVFKDLANGMFDKVSVAASKNIKNAYGKDPDTTGLWNSTMDTLKCCGFNNFTDFADSPYYKAHGSAYPPQCCLKTSNPCNQTEAASNLVSGCFPKIKSLIDGNTVVIAAVSLGIAALEISAMAVSMTLYCRIKSTET